MDGWIETTGRCYIFVRRENLFSTPGFLEEGLSINCPGLSPSPLTHSISGEEEWLIWLVSLRITGLPSLLLPSHSWEWSGCSEHTVSTAPWARSPPLPVHCQLGLGGCICLILGFSLLAHVALTLNYISNFSFIYSEEDVLASFCTLSHISGCSATRWGSRVEFTGSPQRSQHRSVKALSEKQ